MTEEQQNELRELLNELVLWSYAIGLLGSSKRGEFFYDGELYTPGAVAKKQREALKAIEGFMREAV